MRSNINTYPGVVFDACSGLQWAETAEQSSAPSKKVRHFHDTHSVELAILVGVVLLKSSLELGGAHFYLWYACKNGARNAASVSPLVQADSPLVVGTAGERCDSACSVTEGAMTDWISCTALTEEHMNSISLYSLVIRNKETLRHPRQKSA